MEKGVRLWVPLEGHVRSRRLTLRADRIHTRMSVRVYGV